MSASAFEAASAISAIDAIAPGRYRANVPDGWQQGRGAFGGLVLAILLRAMERQEADRARVVRTLTGDLAGPVLAGEAEVRAEIVRRGSNQSNARAELRQGSEVLAYATAVFSAPRPQGLALRPRIAVLPAFTGDPLPMAGAAIFTRHYEYRATGSAPFSGAAEPVVEGWVRLRDAPSAIDAALLLAFLDAFWPACFSTTTRPRPMATISFTAEILADPRALDPASPFFYKARTICDHDGFQLEMRELYDARGDVVAMNQQTFAVLK